MKTRNQSNTCIRQCRDGAQISRCRDMLGQMQSPLSNLAEGLRLAGNEVRLKILVLLGEEGRLCVCDLAEIQGMTIPAVSQHLKKMKTGGLLFTEREGTTVFHLLTERAERLVEALTPFVYATSPA